MLSADRLDEVDDVVEPARQVVDVLAIERRDEGLLEPFVDVVVDLVALLLERLDLGDPIVEPVEIVDQVAQLGGGSGQVLAAGLEQVQELDRLSESVGTHVISPSS